MQHSISGFAGSSGMLSLATAHTTAPCPFRGEGTAAQQGVDTPLALSFGAILIPISWICLLVTFT